MSKNPYDNEGSRQTTKLNRLTTLEEKQQLIQKIDELVMFIGFKIPELQEIHESLSLVENEVSKWIRHLQPDDIVVSPDYFYLPTNENNDEKK